MHALLIGLSLDLRVPPLGSSTWWEEIVAQWRLCLLSSPFYITLKGPTLTKYPETCPILKGCSTVRINKIYIYIHRDLL